MLDATPLLRAFARYRLSHLDRQDAQTVQRQQLTWLLQRARHTRFGRDHNFQSIASVDAFQDQVPLRTYDDFWSQYWQDEFPLVTNATWPEKISYFAKTSGTTSGISKYIPVSDRILRGNRRAVLDMLAFHVRTKPHSRVLGGKNFMLSGSADLEELAPGIYAGDMSALATRSVPYLARSYFYPPPDLARIQDWEQRLETFARRSTEVDIRAIGGTASWLLLFLQNVVANADGGLTDCYPNLELIAYGGVNFDPYRAQYEALIAGSGIDLRENYAASEGFLALADRGVDEGLRLQLDSGIFYEFVPVEELGCRAPRRFWIGTAEPGVNYALILSTPAGAWAYILGDTVRFVDLDPPRLLVTGRTSTSLSAFGEHLIEEEIVHAVTAAATEIDAAVTDFTVGAVYPSDGNRRGHHLFIVEFAGALPTETRLSRFRRHLDAVLKEINEDYRAHREADVQMAAPEVIAAAPGSFTAWLKSRGRLGGQHKVPRVIADTTVLASLRNYVIGTETQPALPQEVS